VRDNFPKTPDRRQSTLQRAAALGLFGNSSKETRPNAISALRPSWYHKNSGESQPVNGNFNEILEIKKNFGTKKRTLLHGACWKLSVSRISKILVLSKYFYIGGSQYIVNVCSLGTQSRSRRAKKKRFFFQCSIPVWVTRFYSRKQIESSQAMFWTISKNKVCTS